MNEEERLKEDALVAEYEEGLDRIIEFRKRMPENDRRCVLTTTAMLDVLAKSRKSWLGRRLGASTLGSECERASWYQFRWAADVVPFRPSADYYHPGQYIGIYESGHHREASMVNLMRAAGLHVEDVDADTGKQFEYTALQGHLVCRIDGKIYGVKEAPKEPHIWEGKSLKRKYFLQICKKGVKHIKPEAYDQVQVAMALSGIEWALYMGYSKDTEDYYAERIPLNNVRCNFLLARAKRIIFGSEPPPRFTDDEDAWQCRWCDYIGVCRKGEMIKRNCRTCLHSTPVKHGQWTCASFANARAYVNNKEISDYKDDIELITSEAQERGCKNHLFMPTLVPGDILSTDGETVTYKMKSGKKWTDDGT